MCLCNLNARFTPIFIKITLIPHLLIFCKIRRKIKKSDGRNQVKRKLLIYNSFLATTKWFATKKEKARCNERDDENKMQPWVCHNEEVHHSKG